MALIQEYFDLTKQYKEQYGDNTIVFIQVGAFFEVYGMKTADTITGSSIAEFSRICDLNIADKKSTIGKYQIIMAGFSHYMIDKYLKKLQDVGYTVVVFTQDDDIKTKRSLNCIYSPGTYFSHDSIHITNNTTCIWINVVDISASSATYKKLIGADACANAIVRVGISNIDILTGKTCIFEFKETYLKTPTTFDELERFISIYRPSEVIVIAEGITNEEIDDIVNYSGIQALTIHKINLTIDRTSIHSKQAINCEKQIFQTELFNKFYREIEHFIISENTYATQSLCFLLDFIYQHNPSLVNNIAEPTFENCSDRLILANHSLKQLNIIQDGYIGNFSSVEKLLNLCVTSMGRRHFSHLLLNPTTNCAVLKTEYDMIGYLIQMSYPKYVDDNIACIHFRKKLSLIKDLSKIRRQFVIKKITPQTIFYLHSNMKTIRELNIDERTTEYIIEKIGTTYASASASDILSSFDIKRSCEELEQFIETHMNIPLCETIDTYNNFDINFIQREVDATLDKHCKKLSDYTDQLESIRLFLNQIISKFESKEKHTDYVKLHEPEKTQINLIATKRRCVILKKELYKNTVLTYISSYDGVSHTFQLACEGLSFVNQSGNNDCILLPQIQELCKNIALAKTQLKDIIYQIYLNSIVDAFSQQFSDKLEQIILFVTYLDVIHTKAFIAQKYHYCCPQIAKTDTELNDAENDKSFFSAKGMRHPLIEHLQQNEIYVPNDVSLGMGSGSDIDGMLLYGTNAVGKTSLIRAVGIIVIMAQAGLYVPCSSLIFRPYRYIFTRILGNDNIFKGLSTFAVEMLELRTILRLSNKNSLVLGDELCSGTESISAKSIFVAGVQHLLQKKCSFIFATHLHEIVDYEEIRTAKTLSLKHLAVIYNRENQRLIYDRKIRDGAGSNIYGLEVCRSLHLPADFIEAADKLRAKYNPSSGSLLSLKTSKYNSKKVRNMCEMCGGTMSTEVHHLVPQKMADFKGFIYNEDGAVFHKNHLANLKAVCEACHQLCHHTIQ